MEGETCAKPWKREGHVDSRNRGMWGGCDAGDGRQAAGAGRGGATSGTQHPLP